MLQLSEITLELGESKPYLRFVLVVYLLSVAFIVYSSLYWLIQIGLIGFITLSCWEDWQNKKPRNFAKKIELMNKQWILSSNKNEKKKFQEAKILLHNVLFQLVQFTNEQEKKQIVIFQDQLSASELRWLHLKIAQMK